MAASFSYIGIPAWMQFEKYDMLGKDTKYVAWDVKPKIDRMLPHVDPVTQEVNDPSCIPCCLRCGGDMFLNVRGGSWFIDQPYESQRTALNKWITDSFDGRIVVLDIGTGFNTPGVVRRPAENLVDRHPNSLLIRINLHNSEVPGKTQGKSIAIRGDVSEKSDKPNAGPSQRNNP